MVLSLFLDRWPGGLEEVLDSARERRGVFGALEVVASRQQDQRCVGDASGQHSAVCRGNDTVVSARYDEGGSADGTEERDARPARDCQRLPEQAQSVIEVPGTLVGERPNAAQDGSPATRGCTDAARGRDEDQPAHPVWDVARQLLRDGPAVGVSEDVRLSQTSGVGATPS